MVTALILAMVFAIQHAQVRDQRATQRKLDEILLVMPDTANALLTLEHASDELHATASQHRSIRQAALGDDPEHWSRWLSRWRNLGLQDDLDAAVGLVPEHLVSVRGLFQRQVVGGEGLHAERVAAVG